MSRKKIEVIRERISRDQEEIRKLGKNNDGIGITHLELAVIRQALVRGGVISELELANLRQATFREALELIKGMELREKLGGDNGKDSSSNRTS